MPARVCRVLQSSGRVEKGGPEVLWHTAPLGEQMLTHCHLLSWKQCRGHLVVQPGLMRDIRNTELRLICDAKTGMDMVYVTKFGFL